MSYCGTCGSFFSPDCPRRTEGGCHPCPSPYDTAHTDMLAAVVTANAKVQRMAAENDLNRVMGKVPAFVREDFDNAVQPVADLIAKQVTDGTR